MSPATQWVQNESKRLQEEADALLKEATEKGLDSFVLRLQQSGFGRDWVIEMDELAPPAANRIVDGDESTT